MSDVTTGTTLAERRQIVAHEDGVYIGLREADYQEDWALGYTALKRLRSDPADWWHYSPFNPDRPVKPPTKPQDLGSATHVIYLEGVETYDFVYGVLPGRADFPGCIGGGRELQTKCKSLGLNAGGLIDDMIGRLLTYDPNMLILEVEQRKWRQQAKRELTAAADRTVRVLHRMAMRTAAELRMPEGQETITLREAFTGGLSEVSVFWTDEQGIRHRARFDKLKPNITIDLKTFSEWEKRNFKRALLREAYLRGYILQAVHYEEARHQLRRLVAEGKVFGGTEAQRALLEEIAAAEEWAWGWVFAKTEGAPTVKAIIPDKHGAQFEKARQQREEALANFIFYRDFFEGLDTMWFDPEVVWEPEHTDWEEISSLPED